MHNFLKATSLLLITAVSYSGAQAGSITYQINDYPAVENGFKISGSITTDGTIGALSQSDITAWTWTLSDSTGSTVYGTVSFSGPTSLSRSRNFCPISIRAMRIPQSTR